LIGFYGLETARIAIKSRRYPQLRQALFQMLRKGMRRSQAEVLQGCRYVMVTTAKEARDIAEEIATVDKDRLTILRLGVETDTSKSEALNIPRDIEIAIVSRIESRKNQLAVLDAVESLGLVATFVGPTNPNHKAYVEQLRRRIAESKSTYIPGVPSHEVSGLLARSRVHVSASWFEVSSLVDLDAYLQGCRVVASRCGGTEELLGDDAYYVDPGSPENIRVQIAAALTSVQDGRRNDIERVRSKMATWDEVADRLLDLYLIARDSAT
jgi:glycosyltransferase involved in cell wall biosynthesis